jgi:hypothetical protein
MMACGWKPWGCAVSAAPVGTDPEEWTWIYAHLLLGAARPARYHSQLADTWSCAPTACFQAWMAVILLGL